MTWKNKYKNIYFSRRINKKTIATGFLVLFSIALGVFNIINTTQEQTSAIPNLESISPTRGYIGGNNLVTINGTDLDFDPTFIDSPSTDFWLDTENNAYTSTTQFVDTSFIGGATVKEITSGNVRAILTTDGEVWTTLNEYAQSDACSSINMNQYGAYGNGTTNKTPYTQKVGGLLAGKNIIDIDSNDWQGVIAALDDEGNIYTWGKGSDGALGNNTTPTSQSLPVKVDLSIVPSGSKIVAVSVGYGYSSGYGCGNDAQSHILALDDHGKIYAWGNNGQGRLGIGNTTNQSVPVAVNGGAIAGKNIVKILAGYRTSFAIDEDGKLYAWGTNYRGQLGDGTNINKTTPIAVNISMTSGQIISVGNRGTYGYDPSDGSTIFLDSTGKVYVVGIMDGFPSDYTNSNFISNCPSTGRYCSRVPTETLLSSIETPPFIVDISNVYNSWVLGSDNKLYNYMTGERIYFNKPLTITMDPDGTPASCLDVTIVSDTQITCITSAHVEGTVDVKIDMGPVHKTFSQAFTYSELNVHSITPEEGSTVGGTEIKITGQDFTKMESSLVTQNFSYTGSTQQFTVTEEDDYILEVWGASGGKDGGAGGYSVGKVHLDIGDILNINVGESGGGCLGRTTFGGGGSGYGTSGTCSGSGGGASDIRINDNSLYSRVIVAGGGGGDASTTPASKRANDGYGGGSVGAGGSGIEHGSLYSGGGGQQYQGGGAGVYGYGSSDAGNSGSFGVGGNNGHINYTQVAGAGGGGWYGGGSGAALSSYSQGGGGGSGWIYTPITYTNWINTAPTADTSGWLLSQDYFLSAAQTLAGNLSVPDYNNSGQFMTGNTGNGYARITRYVPNQTAVNTRKVILDNNGTPAVCDIQSWTDEEIVCITSAHVEGTVDILIGNDISSATLDDAFTYTAYIEIGVNSSDLVISDSGSTAMAPTTTGKYNSASNTASVRTNMNGYKLYISTNKPSTDSNASDMVSTPVSGLETYLAGTTNTCVWNDFSSTLTNTSTVLSNNTWGFTLLPTALADQKLCRVPNLTNPLTVKSTITPNETINGDQTTINYGAKINLNQPAGQYEVGIVYTALANV